MSTAVLEPKTTVAQKILLVNFLLLIQQILIVQKIEGTVSQQWGVIFIPSILLLCLFVVYILYHIRNTFQMQEFKRALLLTSWKLSFCVLLCFILISVVLVLEKYWKNCKIGVCEQSSLNHIVDDIVAIFRAIGIWCGFMIILVLFYFISNCNFRKCCGFRRNSGVSQFIH